MSSIENESNVTIVSETVSDLTKYSDRPDTPAILDILAERKKAGNTDKTFPIDLEYLLELREFWNIKTSMTFEQFEHGPENLRQAEEKVRLLGQENNQLRAKIGEFLTEQVSEINKITELRQKLAGMNTIKLPLKKVQMFLALSKDSDSSKDYFYVKLNEQQEMERIFREDK